MGNSIFEVLEVKQLRLHHYILNCAVLNNGVEVIAPKSLFEVFDMTPHGRTKEGLPGPISAESLLPFITEEVVELCKPYYYRNLKGNKIKGYDLRLLMNICDIYKNAKEARVLLKSQATMAERAEVILGQLERVKIH